MNNKKFRIWDGSDFYFASCNDLIQGYPLSEIKCFTDDLVFQQFTNKRDSKGEEIYEGDILYYAHKFECGDLYEEHGEVFYDEETAAFLFDRFNQFSWMDSNVIWDSIKVIGNIFENPKLIEQPRKVLE